uniref:EF-hand domain-containing protein n=1 Tax=Ningiella ruwaisensis TaxID=2364274 RepID=UPI0010A0506D|nr:EF-hand domain-containing protein [Ningiella ruwaisensis]
MKTNNKLGILFTVAALSAGISFASQANEGFKALDANEDGMITKSEAEANETVFENFELIDSDGNGTISLEEYEAVGL